MATTTAYRTPAPLPPRTRAYGPATRQRLMRTVGLLAAVWVAAALPFVVDATPSWKAFGLGLAVPGAGFGYVGGWLGFGLLIAATLLLMLGFVLWFGTGNIVAPLSVWLGGALSAALLVGDDPVRWWPWVVATFVAGSVSSVVIRIVRAKARGRRSVAADNARLAKIELPPEPSFGAGPVEVGDELTVEELQFQRFFFDMALQPEGSWDGYDILDQFQFAALRYQISWNHYALALAHYTRTPAFHGYAAQAQRNLIEKLTEKRAWSYWALENAWGNLRFDPDPIVRDNIMLSGYLALQLGMYESSFGDNRFQQPGSLEFEWSAKRKYSYDTHSVNRAVARNFLRAPFGMFPCEPNWLFPICNVIAMDGLAMYHRLYGLDEWDEILERYRHAVDVEFVSPDGAPCGIRSQRFGFEIRIPFPMDGRAPAQRLLGGDSAKVLGPGPYSPLQAAVLPDIVERALSLGGLRGLSKAVTSGKLPMTKLGTYDVGNYRNTGAGAHPWLTMSAREYGDDAFCEAIKESADAVLDPVTENGVRRYRNLSTLAAGQMFAGRFSRKDGFYDLINRGNPPEWEAGPILDEAPYPDVLVARAVTDGRALRLVLQPGVPGGRNVRIRFARLLPGRPYVIKETGETFIAGYDGTAVAEIGLYERLPLTIEPR